MPSPLSIYPTLSLKPISVCIFSHGDSVKLPSSLSFYTIYVILLTPIWLYSTVWLFSENKLIILCDYCKLCISYSVLEAGTMFIPLSLKAWSANQQYLGASWEPQKLKPLSRPTGSNLHFNRIPRLPVCTLAFEKYCLILFCVQSI